MPDNTSTQVLDDLTEHDVKKVRVEGDLRRRIAARMDELTRDLRRLVERVDPAGTPRTDARRRRTEKVDKESRELIRQAYADLNTLTRGQTMRLVDIESMAVVNALERNIP